ncbi:MAG TPA: VOC family protein [bacterium]|jgi:catechol 2,3-dioxygenase-like lactoylglutathione lyase family enzyme
MKNYIIFAFALFAFLVLSPAITFAQDDNESDEMSIAPELRMDWINFACNDLQEMHDFYTGLLGFEEEWWVDDQYFGMLVYDMGGINVAFYRADQDLEVNDAFAHGPAYGAGPYHGYSVSITVPEEYMPELVNILKAADVPALFDEPTEVFGGVAYPVLDPMGLTVELYYPVETEM